MIRIRHRVKNKMPRKEASFETKEFNIDFDTDLSLVKPIEIREEEFDVGDEVESQETTTEPDNVEEQDGENKPIPPIEPIKVVQEETLPDEIVEDTTKKKRVSLKDKLNGNS